MTCYTLPKESVWRGGYIPDIYIFVGDVWWYAMFRYLYLSLYDEIQYSLPGYCCSLRDSVCCSCSLFVCPSERSDRANQMRSTVNRPRRDNYELV